MRCSLVLLVLATPAYADHLDDLVGRGQCGTSSSYPRALPNCPGTALPRDPHVEAVLDDDLSAQQAAATDPPVSPVAPKPRLIDHEQELHWQAELDTRFGTLRADGLDLDYVFGLNGAAGLRMGRLALLGEYAIAAVAFPAMSVGDTRRGGSLPLGPTDGVMHRFGALARYSVAKAASDPTPADGDFQVIGELWLEAGLGEEIINWDGGGEFTRPDIAFGIGTQLSFRTSAYRRGGLFVAFRVHVAHRTDVEDVGPTCSALCTVDTPPSPWGDRSYLLDVGFVFGD